jgi:quercetin dioxygenase-like cupin family protein
MRDPKNRLVDDRHVLRTLALLALAACTSSHATSAGTPTAGRDLVITRREAHQTSVGPAENFTGTARVQRLFLPAPPSRMQGAYVTFEPGAHTAWHTHPAGQILVVTAGSGYVQQWGGQRQDIREGDVVWTPPNVKHWHGATPTSAMTHMAIVEQLEGKSAEWMEKVSDAQYSGGP